MRNSFKASTDVHLYRQAGWSKPVPNNESDNKFKRNKMLQQNTETLKASIQDYHPFFHVLLEAPIVGPSSMAAALNAAEIHKFSKYEYIGCQTNNLHSRN